MNDFPICVVILLLLVMIFLEHMTRYKLRKEHDALRREHDKLYWAFDQFAKHHVTQIEAINTSLRMLAGMRK